MGEIPRKSVGGGAVAVPHDIRPARSYKNVSEKGHSLDPNFLSSTEKGPFSDVHQRHKEEEKEDAGQG